MVAVTDYAALGLMAGIEIHQQLDTATKLFCRCPTTLRKTGEHTGEFSRYLRATVSEMGEIDEAAKEEMKHERLFRYYTYDTTCLVENDEEPPAPLNQEALGLCLVIARLFSMTPVQQINTMRKLVIDGSNTSGFQRTALVAIDGTLPADIVQGGVIETICLEEEAAQRVEGDTFSLDRLGIPLVEITTSPCMRSPEEVARVAEYLGMVLRSTGQVKRGLGTIRQDVNISIRGGARIEIKGVQELELIAEVVRREADRQTGLLAIRDELRRRGASVGSEPLDVTGLFAGTGSAILKKAKCILALNLPGFAGLTGREIQPGRRLGSELADYAKKCGVGGIFHTDELPAYGITAGEVETLRSHMGAGPGDCVVIVADTGKKASCAMQQVIRRARMALEGVPEETRKMLEGGSTAYMRPLPGAARMYPETDVLPEEVSPARWQEIPIPELLSSRVERFQAAFGFDAGVARSIAYSERLPLFERAVAAGVSPNLAYRTLLSTLKELGRDGVSTDGIADDEIIAVLAAVEGGRAAKEGIPGILREVASGTGAAEALSRCARQMSDEELAAIVRRIVNERGTFVRERGKGALGPLMGVVMEEARGAADGKRIAGILGKEIARFLAA